MKLLTAILLFSGEFHDNDPFLRDRMIEASEKLREEGIGSQGFMCKETLESLIAFQFRNAKRKKK